MDSPPASSPERPRFPPIDMLRHGSIHLWHFVPPGPGRCWPRRARCGVLALILSLATGGCARQDSARPVEDTETSGRISIAASPDVRALVAREISSFRASYPQATLELREPESSAQVIGALLGGRADVAVVGRDLEEEERNVARQAGIELDGHRIARDAVCVVVPASNPVRNLTVRELQRIWSGEATNWSAFGGRSGRILPVLPPLSGDLVRAFAQAVLDGEPLKAPSMVEAGDSAVAARVATTPGAIGLVPLARAADPGLRALAIAPIEGLAYVEPDMQSVHEGQYPLTFTVNLYRRTRGARLAGGFVTHVASQPGQQLVLDGGRVPTSVPLRFVRRSPLLGSH